MPNQHQEPRLPAGRRGSVSIVDLVRARSEGTFYEPDTADVVITPEDELVVKLALAMKAALGPALAPTGWTPTKEAPASRIYSRAVVLGPTPIANDAGAVQLFGVDQDRRAVRIWTAGAAGVAISQDRYALANGAGVVLPPNVVLNLNYAGPVWVGAPTGTAAVFTVYGLAEASEVRNVPRLGSLHADAHGDEAGGS